jgi:hypothetical protein
LALVLIAATGALAAAEDGGQAEAWTKLPLGARSAALGQAVSALPGDAGAALLNPALSVAQTGAETGSQLAFLPDGRQLQGVGIARPFWNQSSLGWSLGYTQYGVDGDFERRRGNTADPDSTFKESASQIHVGVSGWAWEQRLSVGAALKVYSHALGDANGGGLSSDLGLYFRCLPWLDLAACARDVFSRLAWSTEASETLPLELRLGARAVMLDGRLQAAAELEDRDQQALRPRLGLEGWPWAKLLALRAGFDGQGWDAGLGLRLTWQQLDWGLDYALSSDPLAAEALQQRVSLEIGVPL